MPKIIEIIRMIDKGEYGIVEVLLDDGSEAEIFNGGEVVVWFDPKHNKIKAFVKRTKG